MKSVLYDLDLYSSKIARWGLTVLVFVLVIFVFLAVVGRYVIGWTPFFLEELSRYLLIWTGCLGASLAIKSGGFPNVGIFLNWFPPEVKKAMEKLAKIILTVFLLFLFVVGIIMSFKQQNQMAATLPISMMWPYLSIPFGILLILPYSFSHLFYHQKEEK